MRGLTPTARRLIAGAAMAILALLIADLVVVTVLEGSAPPELRRFLDLTLEANLPTGISVGLLLLAAGVAAGCARASRRDGEPVRAVAGWLLIAAFFAYMAVDDALQLHERAATALAATLREGPRPAVVAWFLGFPSYYWQVLFLPLFGGAGLFMLVFALRRLPSTASRKAFLAGLACYGLAVGLDFAEGADKVFDLLHASTDAVLTRPQLRHLMRAYEEAIEMLGTALLAGAMLERALIHRR